MSNFMGDRDDLDSVMRYTCACGKYGSDKPAPAVSSEDELHTITSCPPETVRIDDATYSRPFPDAEGRMMISVSYDDGERFVTYGVTHDVLDAWAEVDLFGRQLTHEDI